MRRLIAVLLVILASVSFALAGTGTWLQRNTLNESVWAKRVGPLGEEPEIQAAVSKWATVQLLTTVDLRRLVDEHLIDTSGRFIGPLANRATTNVEAYVSQQVERFVTSERFATLWKSASTRAHREVVKTLRDERDSVKANDDKVEIDFTPILQEIIVQITGDLPQLLGDGLTKEISIPRNLDNEETRSRLSATLNVSLPPRWGTITFYDRGKLSTTQTVVYWTDRLPIAATALTAGLAIGALVISNRRRSTAVALACGFALMSALVWIGTTVSQAQAIDTVRGQVNRDAAKVILDIIVGPLTTAALISTVVMLVTAVILGVALPKSKKSVSL